MDAAAMEAEIATEAEQLQINDGLGIEEEYEVSFMRSSSINVSPIEVSAAHFIHTTVPTSKCQKMHGHNYIISVTLEGVIESNSNMIVDANDIKKIVDEMDHKTLVPEELVIMISDKDSKEVTDREICDEDSILFENPTTGKVYLMPASDCYIMPIASISAETMAYWLASVMMFNFDNVTCATVSVSETSKLTATESISRL